jgi:hypothetical protein
VQFQGWVLTQVATEYYDPSADQEHSPADEEQPATIQQDGVNEIEIHWLISKTRMKLPGRDSPCPSPYFPSNSLSCWAVAAGRFVVAAACVRQNARVQ